MHAPSVDLDSLITELNYYVDPHKLPDYAPTGLQVRAQPERTAITIQRVALAVSATQAAIRDAGAWNAELLVTHHGLFWGTTDPGYDANADPARPYDEAKVELLRSMGVSLAAYHLPLDAHPEVGNNIELARRLGLDVEAFDLIPVEDTEVHLGLTARSARPLTAAELRARAESAFQVPVLIVPGKPDGIQRIGIVSGGATRSLYEAIAQGCDAFITGEGREWAYGLAYDAGVTMMVLGHYASERYGVQALGAWISRRTNLAVRFFEEPNPF
jgi:dinuclear metal center YbgI/SA1388 family protein